MSAVDSLAAAVGAYGEVRLSEPLARHTTFGIGGPADVFLTVRDATSLAAATNAARHAGVPIFVLGSGSNILVADAGVRGLTIDNRARAESVDSTGVHYRLESGVSFAAFARKMCRLGMDGLAWAVGIPGTLGGACVYNAGAYGGCLADVLTRACLQEPDGSSAWVEAADLGLVYRGSSFARGHLAGRTVLEAEVRLAPGDSGALTAQAGTYDAKRLAAQPRGRNAGSTFKNPAGQPAWKLIDEVGMRGATRGDAAISDKHSNFFVNHGNAAAADVAWLIAEAQRRVNEQFGIQLEREVEFVGAW